MVVYRREKDIKTEILFWESQIFVIDRELETDNYSNENIREFKERKAEIEKYVEELKNDSVS